MASYTFEANVAAPADTVFDVLTDHRGYSKISSIRAVELEREGDPAPNGVGAIRVLKGVGPPLREEVVEYERPSRFVYRLLSGAPVRDHVGTVELAADDGGTRIVYRVDSTPTIPLAAPVIAAVARVMIRRLFNGIVKEAERRATIGG
jgi:uncharacterized protein YndB with AHSA1/START domain